MARLFPAGALYACAFALSLATAVAHARGAAPSIVIPERIEATQRNITTDDLVRLRQIDSLSVSPDGEHFAILVREAVPEANTYRTAWFVGSLGGEALTYVGDGGEARLLTYPSGHQTGDFGGSVSRWSPDGRFIAYMVLRNGEVQLWRSRADGRGQRQLTRNAGDVRDFAWSEDGRSLYFKVGSTRDELLARAEADARRGYRLQDFQPLVRAINPGRPRAALETNLAVWRVDLSGRGERLTTAVERAEFDRAEARQVAFRRGGVEVDTTRLSAALQPPVVRRDGATAWLERTDPSQDGSAPLARLTAQLREGEDPVACTLPLCEGQLFVKIWWSEDSDEVLFWRVDGETDKSHSIYAWRPSTGAVRTLISAADHMLRDCALSRHAVICLRETPLEPRHVAIFDVTTGAVTKVADVNPEMANFRLGRVERIEWDSDPRALEFGYSPRAHGFILYPPDYDPSRSYPIFVAPYFAGGFLRDIGDEHPLLVYAANGFIVLHAAYPGIIRVLARGNSVELINQHYNPDLGYPQLSIFSGSTSRGLDMAMARANVDQKLIGIGGVSQGAYAPQFIMQHSDRFSAVSVSSGGWDQLEYYLGAPLPEPYGDQPPLRFPENADFWAPIDLAQHLETIEAPILFHMADTEVVGTAVLIRRMADARLAFEAYSFPNERHLKWQSAHRLAIWNRNLDWFRFWLQDIEDPDPAKAEQYERWRQLRELQCRNARALRNYCEVVSIQASPAR